MRNNGGGNLASSRRCYRHCVLLGRTALGGNIAILRRGISGFHTNSERFLHSVYGVLDSSTRFYFSVGRTVHSNCSPVSLTARFLPRVGRYRVDSRSLKDSYLLPLGKNFRFSGFFGFVGAGGCGNSCVVRICGDTCGGCNRVFGSCGGLLWCRGLGITFCHFVMCGNFIDVGVYIGGVGWMGNICYRWGFRG